MEIGTIIALGAAVISLLTLVFTRIDKAKKDAKEDNLELLNYKVDELKKDMAELLSKFDRYESEIDEKIDKAINLHVKIYHKRGGKNDN
jgi:outer membrane murein-binding lipoprotein Lpp